MDCNIRNVPQELIDRMKRRALDEHVSMRAWVIKVWEEQFAKEASDGLREAGEQRVKSTTSSGALGKSKAKSTGVERRSLDSIGTDREADNGLEAGGSEDGKAREGKKCPECGLVMMDWGQVWKCNMCRREVAKRN